MENRMDQITPLYYNDKKRFLRLTAQFAAGGFGYGAMEIFYRGYTHFSMIITGGVCFSLLIRISRSQRSLAQLCIAGGACITAVEFAVGCIVNLWLKWDVWDYSQQSAHLMGQICPKFFLLWCALCAAILPLCRYFRRFKAASVRTFKSAAVDEPARLSPAPADHP